MQATQAHSQQRSNGFMHLLRVVTGRQLTQAAMDSIRARTERGDTASGHTGFNNKSVMVFADREGFQISVSSDTGGKDKTYTSDGRLKCIKVCVEDDSRLSGFRWFAKTFNPPGSLFGEWVRED